jgi:hypothetical protein
MADVLRDPSTVSRLASGALATAADLNIDRHVSGLEQILRGVALKVSVPA